MKITVILCTYNRCESLRKVLGSLASQVVPHPTAWEVLVVDNNSSDQTRKVVEEFSKAQPGRFHYLFERQPGKSHALNTGIREARGDIIAFVDDDVTMGPTWLQNLTVVLHDRNWAGAGGRIVPEPGFSAPQWLSLEGPYAMGGVLALFDLGSNAKQLTEPPFGTNMAYRKEMFERYGGFRVDLGPRPRSEIRGEDTEFGRRLLNAGEKLRYDPSAVVYHPVPENRLKKEYFLRWKFDKGRAEVREYGIRPNTKYYLGGVPLYLFRNLAVWTMGWVAAVGPSLRFSRKLIVWEKMGEILECYRQSVDSKRGIVGAENSVPPEIVWPVDTNHP